VDAEVARIAARQHGVASVQQLLDAGVKRGGVRRRVVKGTLHPEFRGVYRVGHRARSTATAITTRATRGSRTGGEKARPGHAAMSSAATPMAT
jgi:hypothetical protein